MANASLNWQANDRFSMQLLAEARSKRYRDTINGVRRDYQDYTVLHLGAQYRFNEHVTVSGRINNLLDQDFTTFQTVFNDLNNDSIYTSNEVSYLDDYNNKDKSRNLWLSLNVSF